MNYLLENKNMTIFYLKKEDFHFQNFFLEFRVLNYFLYYFQNIYLLLFYLVLLFHNFFQLNYYHLYHI